MTTTIDPRTITAADPEDVVSASPLYRRDGLVDVCRGCGAVREGTGSWAYSHYLACDAAGYAVYREEKYGESREAAQRRAIDLLEEKISSAPSEPARAVAVFEGSALWDVRLLNICMGLLSREDRRQVLAATPRTPQGRGIYTCAVTINGVEIPLKAAADELDRQFSMHVREAAAQLVRDDVVGGLEPDLDALREALQGTKEALAQNAEGFTAAVTALRALEAEVTRRGEAMIHRAWEALGTTRPREGA